MRGLLACWRGRQRRVAEHVKFTTGRGVVEVACILRKRMRSLQLGHVHDFQDAIDRRRTASAGTSVASRAVT